MVLSDTTALPAASSRPHHHGGRRNASQPAESLRPPHPTVRYSRCRRTAHMGDSGSGQQTSRGRRTGTLDHSRVGERAIGVPRRSGSWFLWELLSGCAEPVAATSDAAAGPAGTGCSPGRMGPLARDAPRGPRATPGIEPAGRSHGPPVISSRRGRHWRPLVGPSGGWSASEPGLPSGPARRRRRRSAERRVASSRRAGRRRCWWAERS